MKKILIIEDDNILSETLADNLAHEGYEIIQEKDGESGLSSALHARPDLILLDILLPKMDGLTVLHNLRKDEWGKNVPVIVMSNVTEPFGVATVVAAGVHEYLHKSDWTMDAVIKRVRDRLK